MFGPIVDKDRVETALKRAAVRRVSGLRASMWHKPPGEHTDDDWCLCMLIRQQSA